jgi:hypothetical protein
MFLGQAAGYWLVTGDDNVGIGQNSMASATTGYNFSRNIGIGSKTLELIRAATNNLAAGYYAGGRVTTGSSSVFLGAYAGSWHTSTGSRLVIDNQDRGSEANEMTKALLYGVFSSTSPSSQTLRVNGRLDTSYGANLGDGGTSNYAAISATGDVTFVGSSGLCFGEIYAYNANDELTISGTGIANKVQVTSFSVNGVSNGTTPDHTNDHITIATAGKYMVSVSAVVESAAAGVAVVVGMSLAKNNGATLFDNVHAHRALAGGGGDTRSISCSGIVDLAASDTLELWVYNDTNTDNIVIDDITMSIIQIGG